MVRTTGTVTKSQQQLLTFIAKYRFVTVAQVKRHFNYTSRTSVNNKLKRLVDAELIGMTYDDSKRYASLPAIFYLTPKGLRVAQKAQPYITDAVIRASYSDKSASESLIAGSGEIFELAQSLSRTYPDMKVLTARQLGDLDYFPRPLPDLYLAQQEGEETQRFFLYKLRDVKRWDVAVRSTVSRLIAYREADTYTESGNEFPIVLFVCHSASIERLAQLTMRSALNKSYESIPTYTTSYSALVGQESAVQPIWSSIDDPDELLSLFDVSP